MSKVDLSKVSTSALWGELSRRKEKENFSWYYIDLGEALERINPSDDPRKYKTLKGEEKLRRLMRQEADDGLQDLLFDNEMSWWENDEQYDDFFVDENT
jgi:hypothetical protein